MAKKKLFLTLDTETATLPFINELCSDAESKKKICIAKPLVYDIGWTVSNRKGNIIEEKNFLVQETFFVPTIFNTAYYANKRPLYIDLLKKEKITCLTWNQIIDILVTDINKVDAVTAYNACFDFKKAIPFTETYIKNLYSDNYINWEKEQRKKCKAILKGEKSKNPDYLIPIFKLRNTSVPIIDLWNVASENLNHNKYKNFCLKNNLWTNSVQYFSTSAESVYKYYTKNANFEEQHTALDDAKIETEILTKALKKGKVEPQIKEFPFRKLGTTIDYVKTERKYLDKVLTALEEYLEMNNAFDLPKNGYWAKMVRMYDELTAESGIV